METRLIYKKNQYITLNDLNKKVLIYNGKIFHKLIISKPMVGYKFGEFITTRKVVMFKKKN